MKSSRWIVLVAGVAFLCLATAFAVRSTVRAEEKKSPADRENPFEGKIIMVYAKSDTSLNYPAALENPAFIQIKGEPYLMGKRTEEEGSAWNALPTLIPFSNVAWIYEFENLESYRGFSQKQSEEAEKAGRAWQKMFIPGAIPGVLPEDPDSE